VHARRIVTAVTTYRDRIDARIEEVAPTYPVVQLARIDRALLRSGMGELLHCPTTPARVAISEWVELARTYSGEPARRLVNGVLGRVARDDLGAETTQRTGRAVGRKEDEPGKAAGQRREHQ
jgi:N utilization substance protein B